MLGAQVIQSFKSFYKICPLHWIFSISFMLFTYVSCKDQIWVSGPKGGWTKAQKAQNNEFVESGLENWTLVNQTTR